MTQILINGKPYEIECTANTPLSTVIHQLRERFNTETSIVSNILIDGADINNQATEQSTESRPLSEVGSIEIFTSHPKEVAEETLNCLDTFAVQIQELSIATAEKIARNAEAGDLEPLIDGLKTFSEAVHQVKIILKTSHLAPIPMLEADLLSILKDLFEFMGSGDKAYVCDLLNKHLPQNLTEWREKGIPTLRTSRDS